MIKRYEKIEIKSKSDLKDIVEYLLSFKFDKNDNKDEHEKFSILMYSVVVFSNLENVYPISIYWGESPDFILKTKEENFGIEHTRATVQTYKMAEREFINYPEGSHLELSFYKPKNGISKRKAIAEIKKPNERLTGLGWSGYQPENEWAEVIIKALENKIQLYKKDHFKKHDNNELIIEDDSPTGLFIKQEIALNYLNNKLKERIKEQCYSKVHIISKRNIFIKDIWRDQIQVNIKKERISEMV